MTKELAKTLTIALVSYLDENRPEGTMDCSSGECVSLEKSFVEENFDGVETLINKKLSRLTEFESSLRQIIEITLSGKTPNGSGGTMSWAVVLNDDEIKKLAPKILALAKKELCPFCDEHLKGFSEGYDKANENKSYRFPTMSTTTSGWGCDGIYCTNPHGDCINCPKRFTSGGTITSPNTASGTSTSKAEG